MVPLRRKLYVAGAVVLARLIRLMPYRTAVGVGGGLGWLAYYLVRKSRVIAQRQIAAAFPEKPAGEVRRIARAVFVNQGKNAFELFSFPALTSRALRRIVRIENRAAFEHALADGKGVLIAGAHCGNWEMMGAGLADAGFPINVIAKRIYLEGLNDLLVGLREEKRMHVILRSDDGSARQILRALKHNESVALLIDQDTSVQGVFVPFFGRPSWTPAGLASLSLRTGAAVILALDVREPGDTHRVVLSGPFAFDRTGDEQADIVSATARVTALIEEHIRKYPDQWVWMHERWKTVPS